MKDITAKEMNLVLAIFKSPEKAYNANSISKKIGVTPMGALKIMKRLEKQGILKSRAMGKAVFYKINFESQYARDYLVFLLKREGEQSSPYTKRWLNDIKKIKNADIAILFGSVLEKKSKANDIDILLVTEQKNFKKLKKEVEDINKISEQKIHPIYQTMKDLKDNIKKEDKTILNAIKGIIDKGYEEMVEVLE